MYLHKAVLYLLVAGLFSSHAAASEDSTHLPEHVAELEHVVVSGSLSGPPVVRLRNGAKTLLLFGVVDPAPIGLTWDHSQIEMVLSESQVVVSPPGIRVGTNVGLFGGVAMLRQRSLMNKNPESKRILDLVSPDAYARWSLLKATYLSTSKDDVDRLRPVVAARMLSDSFNESRGLVNRTIFDNDILPIAKRMGIPVRAPELTLAIPKPRELLLEYNASHLNDRECFLDTIQAVEEKKDNDLARANAWATGNVSALGLIPKSTHKIECARSMVSSVIASKLGN